jgi:hypothetical protein
VAQCKDVVQKELGAHKWAEDQIGTVHIMQGRKADVVVLVLGIDPSPAKKARDWAARPANLLNVAGEPGAAAAVRDRELCGVEAGAELRCGRADAAPPLVASRWSSPGRITCGGRLSSSRLCNPECQVARVDRRAPNRMSAP